MLRDMRSCWTTTVWACLLLSLAAPATGCSDPGVEALPLTDGGDERIAAEAGFADAPSQEGDGTNADAEGQADSLESGGAVPSLVPSRHHVQFTITNRAETVRYVVKEGRHCTAFAIVRMGDTLESLGLEIVPGGPGNCAGMDYDGPYGWQWARLEPGQSYEMSWDGRALVLYDGKANCFSDPGIYGVLQPVEAGDYRVLVPYVDEGEMSCDEDGGVAVCDNGPMSNKLPVPLSACNAPGQALADFAMPAEGQVVVVVDLE
jgi:hypothetical protein